MSEFTHKLLEWLEDSFKEKKTSSSPGKRSVVVLIQLVIYHVTMYTAQSIKHQGCNNFLDVVGRMYDWLIQHFGKTKQKANLSQSRARHTSYTKIVHCLISSLEGLDTCSLLWDEQRKTHIFRKSTNLKFDVYRAYLASHISRNKFSSFGIAVSCSILDQT